MKKVLSRSLLASCILLLFGFSATAMAATEFMDGRLILNGFLKNTTYVRTSMYDREKSGPGDNHDNPVDFSNISFLCEALYTVHQDEDYTLRLFGGFKWWYELAPKFDDQLRRSLYHRQRKEYISPHQFEDFISEAYVDLIKGPFQVRVGKQIVIWGQLDVNRVADVVNPLDLRWGVPGVDNWEEIKRGLWMIRAFYQSELPGNLLFEFVFNPGDYKQLMLPYQGTHWGSEYFKNAAFVPGNEQGLYSYLQEKWISDAPHWGLDNYEWGFRIRGYTWNVDWTFLLWNARDDGPVARPDRVNNWLTSNYIFPGIKASVWNTKHYPANVDYTVWDYKRFTTIGGTGQTYVDWLWQSIWRVEWFLEINRPLNKADGGNSSGNIYDQVNRNILGIAIQGNWKLDIPWFTRHIGTGKLTDFSLTYFIEKVFNHDHDLVLADRFHKVGESTSDSVAMFIKQEMFNTSWVFIFIGNYYMQCGKWMAVPCFTYIFPQSVLNGGLRVDIGAKLYGGAKHKYAAQNSLSHLMDHKDSIILRLRYEF